MGLVKLTFDGAMNTAKHDAFVNAFLTNYENGIISGLANNLYYSISNGNVTFRSGYVSVYGRRVFVEEGTTINIALDSNKSGYIVIEINTITNKVDLIKLEATGTYPSLIQTNLLNEDGIYQLPIFAYTKSTTSLQANTSFVPSYIRTNKSNLTTTKNEILAETKRKAIFRTSYSGNTYCFDYGGLTLADALITFQTGTYIVTIPGSLVKTSSSQKSISYGVGTLAYSLAIYTNAGFLYITTGSSLHTISTIYLYY